MKMGISMCKWLKEKRSDRGVCVVWYGSSKFKKVFRKIRNGMHTLVKKTK